jgi:hypothetical protein
MDSMKMGSIATKICLKLEISRGMRADPPEGGARGIRAVQPAGGRGVDGDAGGSAALWLSFLVGYPVKGQAGRITGEVV